MVEQVILFTLSNECLLHASKGELQRFIKQVRTER